MADDLDEFERAAYELGIQEWTMKGKKKRSKAAGKAAAKAKQEQKARAKGGKGAR